MSKTLSDKSSATLRTMFVDAVAEHNNRGVSDEDDQRAIDAAELLHQIYRELRTREDGLPILKSLLEDNNAYVVLWAAPFSYNHFPDSAEAALKGLLDNSVHRIRGRARRMLEWRKDGTLVTE
jgi:hypothetical protein